MDFDFGSHGRRQTSIRVTSPSKGVLKVSATHATGNGGDSITSYQYSLNEGQWVKVAVRASESFRVSHLVPAQKCDVRLRSVNVLGTRASTKAESVSVV